MRSGAKIYRRSKTVKIALLVTLIIVLAATAASCKWTVGVVRGSGNMVTEERDVSGFDEIHFSGMGSLIVEQGDKETLKIEADDNIIELIESGIRGDKLYLQFRKGFNVIPNSKVKFYMTVIDLNRVDLSGLGDIECDDFETDELKFHISGSGNVDFNIVAENIETSISGLGDINLSGESDSHSVKISGSGKYDAEELKSKVCEVKVSGLGSATVNVSEELEIDISGAGNVYFTGNPEISQHISGLGRIKSLE